VCSTYVSLSQPLPKEAILIVNARSRKGADLFRDACEKLREAGVALRDSHAIKEGDDLQEEVRRAVASGVPMVIVGGGDGSLSSCVDEFVGKDCVFALLPLGTANSFARTLGVPLDLDGAVEAIASGRRRRIDLGRIEGDYFANCAAIGLSPLIGDSVPHGLKRYLGRVGYLMWAIWCLLSFRSFALEIDDGSKVHKLRALEVRIANGRYHGGVEVVDRARVDSGDMIVQAVTGRARSTLVWNWIATVLRLPARHNSTTDFHGKQLRITTRPPLPISVDGEVLFKTPAGVEVAERAIEVAVPSETES